MLSYSKLGSSNKVLVCLHGFLENKTMWHFLMELSENYKLLLIDLPGHGLSSDPEEECSPTITYHAKKVIDVIQKEKIKSFSIIGHSMGAYVGLEVMRQCKDSCEKLIFLNSNCWSDNEQKKRDRFRLARIIDSVKTLFLQEAIPALFGSPEDYTKEIDALKESATKISSHSIAFSSICMANRSDHSIFVQENPGKFVFIHGKMDRFIELSTLKQRIGKATLYTLENSGHMSHIEDTQNILRIIVAHI